MLQHTSSFDTHDSMQHNGSASSCQQTKDMPDGALHACAACHAAKQRQPLVQGLVLWRAAEAAVGLTCPAGGRHCACHASWGHRCDAGQAWAACRQEPWCSPYGAFRSQRPCCSYRSQASVAVMCVTSICKLMCSLTYLLPAHCGLRPWSSKY